MNEWLLLGLSACLTGLACIFMVYPFRRRFTASLLLVPVIFLGAFTGYFYWGGFGGWQEYLQHLNSQKQAKKMLESIKTPQELIEKLRAKLDETPKSAKGWYLLGRLYSSQNEKQNAVNAFAKAYQFNPDDEQYAVNYAHSLWVLNNQQFTEQITEIFIRLLRNNPNQPDALAMLAMDAFVSHAYEDAISYWQRLLKLAPEQSEEAKAIRKAIAKAEEHLKLRNKNLD
ncbi:MULTISPECIES: tetratricopeptide repeat protein [Legionella]|uniref:Tetratricopeptide repeat protein n=1 Tax=Legionella resiliens TaxID=2905958 RepID=A0ABS8X3P0_9GAMM|nr:MULTISPECIES: tetratricopeptide repeat protein [unclassified Legionella]MCE0724236.1 tetratricopeptide repeat protein [Legionella sp. 9fVS26]MCE3533388.1 tetratricopeptide repeat protein [Legionella sp. 8cVS16]QLZ69573.1 tetratricopeptide repeat protein [Legionella sp. PC1000]